MLCAIVIASHYNAGHLDALSYIRAGEGDAVRPVQPDNRLGVVSIT